MNKNVFDKVKNFLRQILPQPVKAVIKKMREYNYRLVKEFEWNVIAKKTLQIYRECMKAA